MFFFGFMPFANIKIGWKFRDYIRHNFLGFWQCNILKFWFSYWHYYHFVCWKDFRKSILIVEAHWFFMSLRRIYMPKIIIWHCSLYRNFNFTKFINWRMKQILISQKILVFTLSSIFSLYLKLTRHKIF